MKIKILPFTKPEDSIDLIMLHNLIKRYEEDLRTASAALNNFNLEIKVHPTFTKYQSNPKPSYHFTDDETIHLVIPSYSGQEAERVYKMLKEQLTVIRNDFYE